MIGNKRTNVNKAILSWLGRLYAGCSVTQQWLLCNLFSAKLLGKVLVGLRCGVGKGCLNFHRYRNGLNQNVRKGKWTEKEESDFKALIEKHGVGKRRVHV